MLQISEEKLAAIADYQENPLFTPAERAALRYTEEMTLGSVDVPDHVFEELQRHFNTEQIVDLTATIALDEHARAIQPRAADRKRRTMPVAGASSGAGGDSAELR